MQLTRYELNGHADFRRDASFYLHLPPLPSDEAASGLYELPRRTGDAHLYRLAHPLAQHLIAQAKAHWLPPVVMTFDYLHAPNKISVLETLPVKQGWLQLSRLSVESRSQAEDRLLWVALTDDGQLLEDDIARRLFQLPGQVLGPIPADDPPPAQLQTQTASQEQAILQEIGQRNAQFFEDEIHKLEARADDRKVALDQEIKEFDRRIQEARRAALAAVTLDPKVDAQKVVKALEKERSTKRRALVRSSPAQPLPICSLGKAPLRQPAMGQRPTARPRTRQPPSFQPRPRNRSLNVQEQYVIPSQGELPSIEAEPAPDFSAIVHQMVTQVQQLTIDIPRIVVVPKGDVTTGFHEFTLATGNVHYQPVARDLLIQSLQTNQQEALSMGARVASEVRLEDYLVRQLVDFPDISYDDHADLLYDLASQMIRHLESYLADEDEVLNVVLYYQRQLANLIYAQMQEHRWEKATGFEERVTRGFTTLKESAFTAQDGRSVQYFRTPPADRSKIAQLVYGGFQRCLYTVQKFQSDTERKLAIILDREADKWFKPARGQFQIYYKAGVKQREYVPDFVAETATQLYMLEPKVNNEVNTEEVQAKRKAAEFWCQHATDHARQYGGKPWRYVLLPHDLIAENMTLAGLVAHA